MLPLIKDITGDYYQKSSALATELRSQVFPENIQEEKEESLSSLVKSWTHEMVSIGAEVKGLWLVDFDHGNGYYCWTWGENDVLYEHGYNDGFRARKLIEETTEESDDGNQ